MEIASSSTASRRFKLSEAHIQEAFGCTSVHLMPYVSGIGDIDEVLKPLSGKRMLTNNQKYRDILTGLGYDVIMLPQIKGFRTYANTLIVGGTVFMPSYEAAKDALAIEVYESLGYKVIPIRSNYISEKLKGSVHCQTMAYPKMSLDQLLRGLNAKLYDAHVSERKSRHPENI